MKYFASSAANLNDLVAQEALAIGAKEVQLISGGVSFSGDIEIGYKFCLETRVANRLLQTIQEKSGITNSDEFYEASLLIPWEKYFELDETFSVTVSNLSTPWLKRSTFAAMRLKDAIVDRFRDIYKGQRPSVDIDNPHITFHVHIDRDGVKWYIDFSGKDLSKRGYREKATDAALRESLAAAILMRSAWYKDLEEDNVPLLLDPFCGSGTILIEAALMATKTAPGLLNLNRFAFLELNSFDKKVWKKVVDEALAKQITENDGSIQIIGWDNSPKALRISNENIKIAKVENFVTVEEKDFTRLTEDDIPSGENYVVTDPPYGIRVDAHTSIESFYLTMGKEFNTLFSGWNVAILSGDKQLLSYVDMKPQRTNALYNGPLEAQLAHYRVYTKEEKQILIDRAIQRKKERLAQPLSAGAQMAYNRVLKNLKALRPKMEKEGVSSYRIYDADMPEYSAAIDFYENRFIHLQEYAPPRTIKPEDAEKRLNELIDAVERATEVERELIFVKQRKAQRGTEQYEKLDDKNKFYIMREHNLMFFVNFSDYLDTGIFLDHRPIRKYIQENSKDKRFLNLFCYTGSATVNAAKGGALSTVSVDASTTYLDWAKKNMEMNGFDTMNHFYYKDDCIQWLRNSHDKYDLIFCDPPTFSNSKMRKTFDVDRDQRFLVHQCMRHLSQDGTLIFSTNFRRFHLHTELQAAYQVEEITDQTIPIDFKRNEKIHQCYLIRHRKAIVKAQPKAIRKVVKKKN
jgi:23S rRNA (guanine2445-N2)-methyltransferase / 23S rRNA (guanine2069-N7)-methyltransferase